VPEGGGDPQATRLERRIELMAAKLAGEAEARRHIEARLQRLATELAELRDSDREGAHPVASKPEPAAAAATTDAASSAAALPPSAAALTGMERALVAAGIDATAAVEIKRRRDGLEMSEIYLRDLAAREGWLDTPRFATEVSEIERQRTSMRDEIGDEAYDRYLAALDHPNRVAVDEVLLESPAAVAGVQAGDVVLRYGETRIFDPGELVSATRGGVSGEAVRVEIIRQGQRLEVEVPRGPLGIRIAASRGNPGEG
jgi:membrane-associated protease RseP (regulator of RpoE activity)